MCHHKGVFLNRPLCRWPLVLSVVWGLTGCASLNSDFECKLKPGMPCKSITEVNHWVDQQERLPQPSSPHTPSPCGSSVSVSSAAQAKTLRVWLPPYEAVDKSFHEARFVNVVIDEPPCATR